MFGQQELLKLAELCRVGAKVGRDIADARMRNRDELYTLAEQADAIGAALERIVRETPDTIDGPEIEPNRPI